MALPDLSVTPLPDTAELKPGSPDRSTIDYRDIADYMNEDIKRIVMPTVAFVGAEIVLGFFGNLMVLYVFVFRYHICNYKYFVLSLAVIDILTTVTTMPGEIITQLYWYIYSEKIICKVKSFCNVFTLTAEALCLLAIAIDRYRKVCRPFAWQIKPNQAKLICCGIPLLALFVALPTPFLWGERTLQKTYKNMTVNVTICEKDDKFESTYFPFIYISIVSGLIAIILIFMFSCYVFVAGALVTERRRSMRARPDLPTRHRVTDSPASTSDKMSKTQDESDSGMIDQGETSTTSSSSKQPVLTNHGKCDTLNAGNVRSSIRPKTRQEKERRVRSKTLIMFIVTLTFIITTVVYLILVSIIARAEDILQQLNDTSKAIYFFFLRLYFFNHVMNPFIYGALDSEFKDVIKMNCVRIRNAVTRTG